MRRLMCIGSCETAQTTIHTRWVLTQPGTLRVAYQVSSSGTWTMALQAAYC